MKQQIIENEENLFFWKKNASVSVATFRWLLNVDDLDDAYDDAVADIDND